jgi:hypothetical protein
MVNRRTIQSKRIMIYTILTSEELSIVDFNQVLETSADTLRYSLDGSKFLIKFQGNTPSFLEGKQQYNYESIIQILNSSEWAEQN